jgi:predicted transcriptional regulator
VDQLKNELKSQESKYTKLKKQYWAVMKLSVEKDLKLAALIQENQCKYRESTVQKLDLSMYNTIFKTDQLEELQSISSESKGDATFVRKIVCWLYEDADVSDIPAMRTRSKNMARQLLPKEVRNLVNGIFSIRLKAVTKEPYEYLFRLNKAANLTSQALTYLIKLKSNGLTAIGANVALQ